MVKSIVKERAIKPNYEAVILLETEIEKYPSGLGFSEMHSIGQFRSRKEAEKAAIDFIQGTSSAAGYFMRKVRKQ